MVDLNRRRRLAARVSRQLSKLNVDDCAAQCWNTLPIPWKQDQEPYELRYVFGYAMDGTDLPCYILWPARMEDHSFWCLDAWKGDWVQLDKCGFIAPVGIEHFFDFFLLAAAWVCPGRSALQSAKHWCYGRNGHNQKLMRFIKQNNKNMRNQAGKPSTETFLIAIRRGR